MLSKNHVRFIQFVLLFSFAWLTPFQAAAISANPNPIFDTQPDGTPIELHLKGNDKFHWYEDVNGYTVVEEAGAYFYATLDSKGDLSPTALQVGKSDPANAGITPRILPSATRIAEVTDARQPLFDPAAAPPQAITPSGTIKNIVILLRFSDQLGRTLPTNGNFDTLFNAVGGDPTYAPTGSVADAYFENSYGTFTLDSTVYGWVDVPNTQAYYANGQSGLSSKIWELIQDGLNAADALIDFSQFDSDTDTFVDSITFVHSGYAAEFGGTDADGAPSSDRIWSHRWSIPTWTSAEGVKVSAYHINPGLWSTSGTDIGRIGVICHETGHFFGLPDLYDTSAPGEGIGSWGLMANSWGFDGSQLHPPHFSAWSKIQLGWVTPTVIAAPGVYNAPQVETNATVYRIDQGFPSGEYLLIENRQPVGFESVMPQGGLAIYHIDDNAGYNTQGYPTQSGWPENGNHYKVALLQADGAYELERGGFGRGDSGDVYHAGGISSLTPETTPNTDAYQSGNVYYTGNTITNIAASSANMSFQVDFGDDFRLQGDRFVESAGSAGGPFTPASSAYTLSNAGVASLSWQATVDVPWFAASSSGGTISAGGNEAVNLNLTAAANSLGSGVHQGTATFKNLGSLYEHVINVELSITEDLYFFNLNTDPGWTREDAWYFGAPNGTGSNGGDPNSAYTGTNTYGFAFGDYANNLPERRLTTTPLNFANHSGVQLQFQRWLGIEDSLYDQAAIEVSNNGSTWIPVWTHTTGSFSENAWSLQTYDISAVADGQSSVQVRWVMGTTDGSRTYPGWNIDDVRFLGGIVPRNTAWVDFAHTGTEVGDQSTPFKTLAEAIAVLVSNGNGTINIKGNTADSESSETMTITKPMTVNANNGTIKIGTP
ncbi:MAG: M6 family metalloprotease domain-containing protein [Candidatus Hydrogenedentota bacterium]